MSEKAEAETPPEENALAAQPGETKEAEAGSDAGQSNEDEETKASRDGWKPLDEFKGPKEDWVDAKTFNERGREILPIVKAQNKRLERELAEMKKTLKEASEHFSKSEKRAYEQAKRDIEARLDKAVEANDREGVRAISEEMAELTADAKKDAKPSDERPAEVKAWMEKNPWFETDMAMTGAAREIAQNLAEKGYSLEEQLAGVERTIRKEFAHKFENPKRNGAGPVESPTGARKPAGKSFADLPSDAKTQCDRFIKQGIIKSRDEYVRTYQW